MKQQQDRARSSFVTLTLISSSEKAEVSDRPPLIVCFAPTQIADRQTSPQTTK